MVLRGLWWLVSLCTTSKALIINSLSPYSGVIRGPALVLCLPLWCNDDLLECNHGTCFLYISALHLLSLLPRHYGHKLWKPCSVASLYCFLVSFVCCSSAAPLDPIMSGQNCKQGQRDYQAVSVSGVWHGHSHTGGPQRALWPTLPDETATWVGRAFFLTGHRHQLSFTFFLV